MKFQRRYKLTVEIEEEGKQQFLEIKSPLTLEFDITRNTQSSLNSATFKVYNLNNTNRSLIFQNKYNINNASGNRRKVILQAGYETALNKDDALETIFIGDLLEAYSYRQGPDVITYFNALDGAIGAYNSYVNTTIEKGTSLKDLANTMISGIKGLTQGAIGDIQGVSKTSTALNGNNFYLLQKDYKDEIFIDLEKVNILNENEYIKNAGVISISSESGLLETPQRQGTDLVVNMIFEPKLKVGQLAEIKSQINPIFDGQYKVMGIKHAGTISGAIGGECRTTIQLFIGNKLLGDLKGV